MCVSEEKAYDKADDTTPKWTKLIKLLEPNLWHVLYIVAFYGLDWEDKLF